MRKSSVLAFLVVKNFLGVVLALTGVVPGLPGREPTANFLCARTLSRLL